MLGDKIPNSKKILFVITKANWGGAQRYLYDLAIHLAEPGNSVSVAAGPDDQTKTGENLIRKLNAAGIKRIYALSSKRDVRIFNDIQTFFSLLRIIWLERPDIIHLNSSKIGGIGGFAAWLLCVPKIVFTAHGWGFDEDRPWWQKRLILLLSKVSVLFHHKVICVSEHSRKSGERLGSSYKKCVTIHNAIKEIDFYLQQDARKFFKDQYKIEPGRGSVWLGTISELTKNKGLSYLIDALALLESKNWIFLIIGSGELKEELSKQIKIRSLDGKIYILDHLPDAARYLKAFDIFTLTSVKEGLPYVLLEAGSAGLAVIATEVGGIPEIVESEKSGILVLPKYHKMLSEQLERLIKDGNLRRKFGNNLQRKIVSDFKFEIMFEKTKQVYHS